MRGRREIEYTDEPNETGNVAIAIWNIQCIKKQASKNYKNSKLIEGNKRAEKLCRAGRTAKRSTVH